MKPLPILLKPIFRSVFRNIILFLVRILVVKLLLYKKINMKKLFPILLLLGSINLFSQNLVEDFEIQIQNRGLKSNFNKIIVLDSRLDTTNVGVIQKGAFNRKAFLKAKVPLNNQIENVFKALIQSDAKEGELVLNLRDYKFTEITEAFSETGYCYLRADLFVKKESGYEKIDFIDRVFEVNAMDVTKKNIRNGSEKLIQFIEGNLMSFKIGEAYTFDEIKNISNIEKRKTPVYNTNIYVDGIYKDFESFKNQIPSSREYKVTRNKKNVITKLEGVSDGVAFKVDTDFIYCLIDQGKIYLIQKNLFVPVEFKDDDFYFKGRAKVTAKTGDVVLASAFFGIIGGALASNATSEFLMKIDHQNGATVQVTELK